MGVDEASFAYELELEYEKSLDESMTVTSDERVADAVNDSRLVVPAARRSAHFALAPVAEPVDTMVAALASFPLTCSTRGDPNPQRPGDSR